MQLVLSPGVQHTQEADLRAQMLRVGGDGAQRLRRCSELFRDSSDDRPSLVSRYSSEREDGSHHGLVLERDDLNRRRDGEDDVVIGYVEQFRLAIRQPLGSCEALALRTVPVSAGNGKRIKSFCGAKPPQRLRWTNAGRWGAIERYGDFTQGARCPG